jgi:hypothetical protein
MSKDRPPHFAARFAELAKTAQQSIVLLTSDEARNIMTSDRRSMALVAGGWAATAVALLVSLALWMRAADFSAEAMTARAATVPPLLTVTPLAEQQYRLLADRMAIRHPDLDVKVDGRGLLVKAHDAAQVFVWRSALADVPQILPEGRFRFVELSLGEETHAAPSALIAGVVYDVSP